MPNWCPFLTQNTTLWKCLFETCFVSLRSALQICIFVSDVLSIFLLSVKIFFLNLWLASTSHQAYKQHCTFNSPSTPNTVWKDLAWIQCHRYNEKESSIRVWTFCISLWMSFRVRGVWAGGGRGSGGRVTGPRSGQCGFPGERHGSRACDLPGAEGLPPSPASPQNLPYYHWLWHTSHLCAKYTKHPFSISDESFKLSSLVFYFLEWFWGSSVKNFITVMCRQEELIVWFCRFPSENISRFLLQLASFVLSIHNLYLLFAFLHEAHFSQKENQRQQLHLSKNFFLVTPFCAEALS